MDEDQLSLAVRLAAIEYVLTSLIAKITLAGAGGSNAIALAIVQKLRETTRDALREHSFPGADPALDAK